jgi:hypothetical protein
MKANAIPAQNNSLDRQCFKLMFAIIMYQNKAWWVKEVEKKEECQNRYKGTSDYPRRRHLHHWKEPRARLNIKKVHKHDDAAKKSFESVVTRASNMGSVVGHNVGA